MSLMLIILILSLIVKGCSKNKDSVNIPLATGNKISETTPVQTAEEGLHRTGVPIDVDIKTYRLKITGAVDKEVNLTFDELKKMESVREEIELVCEDLYQDNFVDKGYWTGVRVIDLLNLVGIKKDAKDVEFISIDDSYKELLPLELLKNDGFLIAYKFNDKEFSKYNGYPLRLVAKGQAGSYWVKWLGEIKVWLSFKDQNLT